jgi:eukaryotic-like serine/threonine-protein kinase
MHLAAGSALTPHLRLVREIGRGGMGSVWVADHLTLECQVAVKLISAALAGREGALARFSREARTAAQIRSPHLVQIFDHGVMDDGTPYIVMELLRGESLAERLARGGPLALAEVATIVEQLGRALGSAHRLGVVHRDLKPENVFLVDLPDAAEGELFVKLLDFGVARSLQGDEAGGVTQAGALLGTPAYMSPEQLADSAKVGPAADLWSLGVLAYRALTGELPFAGATPVALWTAIAARSFTPATRVRAGLPAELDGWFDRALAIEAADRFPSARAMADELKRLCGFTEPAALGPSTPPPPTAAQAASARAASSAEQSTVDFVEGAALGVAIEPTKRAPKLETSGGSVGGAAATLAPEPRRAGRRELARWGAVALAAVVLVGGAFYRLRSVGSGPASPAPSAVAAGSANGEASAAAPASGAAAALREPTLGLRTVEDYRDPKGATVANLRSASLWSAAAHDLGEAAEQPGAPVRWRAARFFAEGELGLNRGKVADAVAAFRQAVEIEPGWALGHAGLASGLSEQGELDAALRSAERAQQLDPAWWGAVAAAARAYSAAGRRDEAIQEFRRALELEPKNAVLLSEIALSYHAARNDAAADRYAAQALELDPDMVPAHVLRAERALERGDGKAALAEASLATAVAPKSLAAHLAEADALALLGRRDEALAAYALVLELATEVGTLGVPRDRMALVENVVAKKELPAPRNAKPQGARSAPAKAHMPDRSSPEKMPNFDF